MIKNEETPIRLIKKTYLKMINNSVNSNVFRNFYVKTKNIGTFDALDDGQNSCAFFVSCILVIFEKIKRVHGTVEALVKDLIESGWEEVDKPQVGDILVWETLKLNGQCHSHIGFYIGSNQAISNSSLKRSPQKHHMNFGSLNRKIVNIYRLKKW